uniref:SFRICE_024824 n=1 Tax=Spodoptera frugiperda TaxID=7108 RepID=A0A2H1W8J9_SPOFR
MERYTIEQRVFIINRFRADDAAQAPCKSIAPLYTEFFFLFFNAHLCNLIVECTNKRGNKLKTEVNTPRGRFTKWKDVTIPELKVFIGVLLFMGTVKLNRMADYWSTNYLMQLSPHLFMSRDRFYLILRALNQIPIAIDESLILWKGRLSFRQYLKGKRHRYGIKLYILADMYGIIQKIHLYAGSGDQVVGGRNHVNKVVMLLLEKYVNKGHSLYVDNFYTSVGLAEELLNKNTYVTGTLRANRAGNPNLTHTKLN